MVIVVSCSQSPQRNEQIDVHLIVQEEELQLPVDTSFHEVVYKVLATKGISCSDEYINNQIVFDTKDYRYTIWATHPDESTPVFSVWRRPIGTTSKSVLETWSVDAHSGEVTFLLNPSLRNREIVFLNDIVVGNDSYLLDEDDEKQPLSQERVKELYQYFTEAQEEAVKEIKQRF